MCFRAPGDGKISTLCVPRRSTMAKCSRNAFPRRPTVTRFSRDAFPGALPWQDSAAVRSRAAIRGKFCAPCIPKVASGGKIASSRQDSRAMHPKAGWLWRDMRAMHPKCPANRRWRMHRARILPGRGTFRCTGPSNHARRADLAIRRRTARAIAATAPPLWAAERGAGGFLSGRVTLLKECVVLWGVERWRQSWHQ